MADRSDPASAPPADRGAGRHAPTARPAGPAPHVLAVNALEKRFADQPLLRSVTLTIDAGESVALIGESGSGKSTLLNLVAGLEPADGGVVTICGERVDGRGADASAALRRNRLGFVFQAFHLLPQLDALGNVMVPLLLLGVGWREARERALGRLEELGMARHADAMPATLSGGEQQRVAIARALVHRPALLLADEPTGNLDEGSASRVLALLGEACREQGAALLMVTHSQRAARSADRVLRLAHGDLHEVTP